MHCLTIFGMESTILEEAILIVESSNYWLQTFYEFMRALILKAGRGMNMNMKF